MKRVCALAVTAILLVTLSGASAFAWVYVRPTTTLVGMPGQTLTCYGIIENWGPTPVDMHSASVTGPSDYFVATVEPYVANYANRTYQVGDSYSGPIFDVYLQPSVSERSSQLCEFHLAWLPAESESDIEYWVSTWVDIVPEPSSVLALLCGSAGLLFGTGRRIMRTTCALKG